MKQNIYSWIWKWHFIGGLVSLPIVLLLSVSGAIYLFKDDYEKENKNQITAINQTGSPLSFQQQWQLAAKHWGKQPDAIVLSSQKVATQFTSGKFSHKSSLFIHPITGEETGRIQLNKTDMHKVRKFHGELLLGSFGTKIVELVASWMIVLLVTGIYLFWPRDKGLKSLITIRFKQGKRILFRDIHAVTGFWFSALLLIILAGGLPWTDVFGSNFKWLQESTNSGFPSTWSSRNIKSTIAENPLTLDHFIEKATSLELSGQTSISLPKTKDGVFSVYNQTTEFSAMKMMHFDQYSGELLQQHSWDDIGLMMKSRLWLMAFHQGEFGYWNFLVVLITAIALVIISISAIASYLKRKVAGSWSIPKTTQNKKMGYGLIILISIMSILFPLFGLSVIFIFIASMFKRKRAS